MPKNSKKLGQKIIKLRKDRNLTSEQLAFSIGLSKQGLRNVELGIKDPKLSTLELIAEGLKIPLKELFD